jgi:uncharacterized protein (TIGR00266 family)
MEVEILYRPSYSLGVIQLEGSEEVRVEAGAFVSASHGISLETEATGGIMASLTRSMFGGESFFQNTLLAPPGGGEVTVAPALPGDMIAFDLNQELLIQSGSYLASGLDIDLDTSWGGAKSFFASEGLFLLKANGRGKILLSSYGAIHQKDLKSGERYTVDTGHLVAFSSGIGFRVRKVGGWKSTFFSGEGLVVDLTGPGRILMQSRSTDQFLAWLIPQLPKSDSN